MTTTIASVLTRVREMLDEPREASWTNTSLRAWLNDGLNDVARETRQLTDTATIPTIANTPEYLLPANILEVQFVYFTDVDQLIPLDPVAYEGADQVWGSYQNRSSYRPSVFTVWGFPPTLKLRLYPVPTTVNNLILKVSRLAAQIPTNGSGDLAAIDFPDGWVDTLVDYCEMRALRKDRDPRWQEAAASYTAKRDSLKLVDYLDVNRGVLFDGLHGGVPSFISDWNYR